MTTTERPAGGLIGTGRSLTEAELDTLTLAAQGLCNREVAQRMWLAEATVASRMVNILDKLGARNRTHAVALACFAGLISPEGKGPIVNGEQFAAGYTHEGASYEQRTRRSPAERTAARELVARIIDGKGTGHTGGRPA
jgi:DNA-binding CsgD family transcriptional regulator